jgi:uncharacterized protein (DUF1800 family)
MRLKSRSGGVVVLALLLGTATVVTTAAKPKGKVEKLPNDDRTITHVLNRIGFGPAPGDVQRVGQMGLEQYIEQQLHPEKLPDNGLRERLAGFTTLGLSSGQIASRYYVPLLQERKEIQREGFAKNKKTEEAMQAPPSQSQPQSQSQSQSQSQDMASSEAAPKTLPDGALDLAKLPPEERAKMIELRRGQQQVTEELMQQKLLRAIYSDHQLEEQLVDFWFNHFNVFVGKGPERVYVTEYERDVIRPHVFGKFRDLLGATAHSPAMLFYLDNWQSSDPNADLHRNQRAMVDRPFGPRPYAPRPFAGRPRPLPPPQPQGQQAQNANPQNPQNPQLPKRKPGLNENYARELMELHTLGVNGGYTQQDVIEVAKCFTGWTIDRPQQGGSARFDDRRHVPGPKTVLGKKIDEGGEHDGEKVLDMLAAHPSTAKFIATKLVRKFVSDEPPAALVDRVAKTFHDTDGDLREVIRTIITSREFLAPEAARTKVKTPFEFVASALRATGAQVEDARMLVNNLRQMGMPLYGAQPPTGYVDHAETWVNTGALLNRMNFAMSLVNNRVHGVTVDLARLIGATDIDTTRQALVTNMLANEMSDATRATLEKGTEPAQVAALTLGSPEFQRR